MTCQQLVEQLLEYISGELEPQYYAEIEEHILICPSCEAYVHSYRVTITITRQLPEVPLPASFSRRLENLLQEVQEEPRT